MGLIDQIKKTKNELDVLADIYKILDKSLIVDSQP